MTLQPATYRGVADTLQTKPPESLAGALEPPSGVRSMTGFASAAHAGLQIELKSVNSRFLDLTIKLPERLRALEARMRALIQLHIKRGKLELRIHQSVGVANTAPLQLNQVRLDQLKVQLRELAQQFDSARADSLLELIQFPGVLLSSENAAVPDDVESESEEIFAMLGSVIQEFNRSRQREGTRLASIVLASSGLMRDTVDRLTLESPQLIAASQQRLRDRIAAALEPVTPIPQWTEEISERIRQEVAALGLRADIAEELGRLRIHLTEMTELMHRNGEVGKRLDFLCQELNREANTLGSKASSIELTNASIELKLMIEQVREQAQNFE